MAGSRQSIVTFKADESLVQALQRIPNRSAFIRTAILTALDHLCPLCQGTGILTPPQKEHWKSFSRHHVVTECGQCHEWHLVCEEHGTADPHGG